jgi:hypothetical protein
MADRVLAAKKFLIVSSNIRRIALQLGLRASTGTVAGSSDDNPQGAPPLAIAGLGATPARMSPNPKRLFDRLQEYQIGIGGREAAKWFTHEILIFEAESDLVDGLWTGASQLTAVQVQLLIESMQFMDSKHV